MERNIADVKPSNPPDPVARQIVEAFCPPFLDEARARQAEFARRVEASAPDPDHFACETDR